MAMFIRVDLKPDVVKKTPGLAKKLVDVCPVNIFALGGDENTLASLRSFLGNEFARR